MKKFILLSLFSTLLLFAISCYANDEISVFFDVQNQSLVVSGSVGSEAGTAVTVNIASWSEQSPAFSPEHLPIVSQLILTTKNGLISEKIPFSDQFKSGKYGIYFYAQTNNGLFHASNSFFYANPHDPNTAALITRINQGEKISEILTDGNNAELLGIDLEKVNTFIDEASSIAEKLNTGSYDLPGFVNTFLGGTAIAMLRSGMAADNVFQNYASYFGISYEEYYQLSADTRADLAALLADQTYQTGTLQQIYADCCLLAQLRTCSGWGYLKDLMLNNSEILNINLSSSGYLQLSENQQNQVFTTIAGSMKSVQSLSDAANLFYKAVSNLTENISTSGTGSSSGHLGISGGSSGGGGIHPSSMEADTNILKPEENVSNNLPADAKNHWARDYISRLWDTGIINGFPDGNFYPDNNVSRCEFSKIISLAFSYSTSEGNADMFKDVPATEWYAPYVYGLAAKQIILGSDGLFSPDGNLTRQDAAVISMRILQDHNILLEENIVSSFTDDIQISDYAISAVNALSQAEIMTGDENGFRPLNTITRGETTALVCRLIDYLEGEVR
ncbi:S-layer homology domain-containing protein [Ructibacterium gallinarum]|uniref:S-layer homology domain-containing protein n=1 Tax=Ructibacterium gallinarum TaxID=2779355 RepID=A0A9D5M2I9_9FIRM|nr:S-layer homology domain-containing protein [Ructibacterium gallinarum]MBE5040298.1 S-layer homology domain-containing protein [Ructibacterium gallinarum]